MLKELCSSIFQQVLCVQCVQTDFFFLFLPQNIPSKQVSSHDTKAEVERTSGALRSEIENGDNSVEGVIHNYLLQALGIINDPVRPEREVEAGKELSGASWLYNWKSFRQLYSLTLEDHGLSH